MDIIKRVRPSRGYWLSLTVILLPAFGWLISYDFSGLDFAESMLIALKKASAFGGMAMFAWSLVLSGRYKVFDTLFNGLDKVYIVHRFFGAVSLAVLLLHPLGYTLLEAYRVGIDDPIHHFLAYKNLPFTLGRISLYGLLVVGIWSIYAKAKHETFVWVHRTLGVFFVFGAIHAFAMGDSTILATNALLWWYMFTLSLAATLTFIHYSLLSDLIHPFYTYAVDRIREMPNEVWELTLKPRYRILNFKAGQFVYLSFDSLAEKSYHPFSISSAEDSARMQFYIKELGDLTSSFNKLKTGQTVRVKGPYGGFTFDDHKYNKQLWIAGGIGITPFISKARGLRSGRHSPEVELVYATRTKREAFAAKELQQLEAQLPKFNYTLLNASEFGIKSLSDLAEHFGGLDDCAIYMCGPPGMLEAYAEEARQMGIDDRLYYEEFSFT